MLSNKVVLITGAAGLLGSAIARMVVDNGGSVIIGDILVNKGKELENELGSNKALFINIDTLSIDSINNAISDGVNYFGKIDAAIHCAYPKSKQWGTKFENLKAEYLSEDLFGHLGGAILFSQRIIEEFRKNKSGNLIHISSIQGVSTPKFEHYDGTNMVSPIEYSAIKSGIISVTRYLAKYCKGNGIRVNCISLGGILDRQPQSFLNKYRESCNEKGMLDAEDIVGTVLFLLNDHSKYVTGQNIIVDDGWTL